MNEISLISHAYGFHRKSKSKSKSNSKSKSRRKGKTQQVSNIDIDDTTDDDDDRTDGTDTEFDSDSDSNASASCDSSDATADTTSEESTAAPADEHQIHALMSVNSTHSADQSADSVEYDSIENEVNDPDLTDILFPNINQISIVEDSNYTPPPPESPSDSDTAPDHAITMFPRDPHPTPPSSPSASPSPSTTTLPHIEDLLADLPLIEDGPTIHQVQQPAQADTTQTQRLWHWREPLMDITPSHHSQRIAHYSFEVRPGRRIEYDYAGPFPNQAPWPPSSPPLTPEWIYDQEYERQFDGPLDAEITDNELTDSDEFESMASIDLTQSDTTNLDTGLVNGVNQMTITPAADSNSISTPAAPAPDPLPNANANLATQLTDRERWFDLQTQGRRSNMTHYCSTPSAAASSTAHAAPAESEEDDSDISMNHAAQPCPRRV